MPEAICGSYEHRLTADFQGALSSDLTLPMILI
jgi:hypothetical protein